MATRIEDLLVEHMRTCPDKPRRPPGSDAILPHFGHGNCPEFISILGSIQLGPLIPYYEFMGWSDPEQHEPGDEDFEDWVYRDGKR